MIPLPSLWLPILVSAVIVFVASSIAHMVLPHHRSDFGKVPAEDEAQDALRKLALPPGDYMIPCSGGPEGMKDPAFQERLKKGPVVLMTVFRPGDASMGKSLAQWFVFLLFVGVLAAYVTSRALGPGAPYLQVHRFAGVTAFACYAVALAQNSIWHKQKWSTTLKNAADGLIYGFLTGGTFGWLWPR